MQLYRNSESTIIVHDNEAFSTRDFSLDALLQSESPNDYVEIMLKHVQRCDWPQNHCWLPPVESQEIWSGNFLRPQSKQAEACEDKAAGATGAIRPELFLKSTASRVRGHGEHIRRRADAESTIAEPAVALAINARGKIVGYSIGNDVTARDLEYASPLYKSQARFYRGACALGPCLTLLPALPSATTISLTIQRGEKNLFTASVELGATAKPNEELARCLFLENDFPAGCYLLTGTAIDQSGVAGLASGDSVHIAIDGLGALHNVVE